MPADSTVKIRDAGSGNNDDIVVAQVATVDGSALSNGAASGLIQAVKVVSADHGATDAKSVDFTKPNDAATAVANLRATVTTPGTAVAVATTRASKWVRLTALLTNTDQVNIGGSGVLATAGSSTGLPLLAGDSITIPVDDPSKVFVDARVAGEGVSGVIG